MFKALPEYSLANGGLEKNKDGVKGEGAWPGVGW